MSSLSDISGVGLGLKRELIPQIQCHFQHQEPDSLISHIDFVEIAPENWIGAGGKYAEQLAWFADRYPIACHGLCLSLGGPDPLNTFFLKQVKHHSRIIRHYLVRLISIESHLATFQLFCPGCSHNLRQIVQCYLRQQPNKAVEGPVKIFF